jgi:RND family efflux transporter MFP subunit
MKILKLLAAVLLLGATFAGGYVLRAAKSSEPAPPARRVLYYVDPMHPAYTSDRPGIAPDCGMQLEPVYADDSGTAAGAPGHAGHPGTVPANAVRIPPERQQLIGVKFASVESGGGSRTIRTVGKVTADETRIGHVHTRVDGWIEKVFTDFTGAAVSKGQPMLTIYSPEMLASQQELLLARRERDLMQANPLASAAAHGEALFDAARRRLQLWDLSEDQIQHVLGTGQPIRSVAVKAPMSGFVTARNAFPNQRVTADTDLYTITDLSRVWVMASVFESDIAAVRIGSLARITFEGDSAPPIAARVTYIQPGVDPTTRTLQVRLDAANPGTRMKPDMFVSVEFGIATPAQLTVPLDAVVDSGNHQTVFIDLGNGYLEPRAVTVGGRFGDRIAITSGLAAGERIVASGTFLVDSESRLKAAAADMGPSTGSGQAPSAASPHAHGGSHD